MAGADSMYTIYHVNGCDAGFQLLVGQLDDDLAQRYGEMQKLYQNHNKLDHIHDAVIVYKESDPVACGAFKEFDAESVEIKRVFVAREHRRQGLARRILAELESLAAGRGYRFAVLETGIKQFEAIRLYESLAYWQIENYGAYAGNSNSVCMKKELKP